MYDLNLINSAALVAIYNDLSKKPVKKFADKETAVRRVAAALEAAKKQVVADETQTWVVVDIVPAVAEIKKTSSRAIFGEHEVIEHNAGILRDENDAPVFVNPKRKGSKAHARFQIICDRVSLTVGEYLDACVELEGDEAEERFKYRRDIAWDIEHGHITFPNGAEG